MNILLLLLFTIVSVSARAEFCALEVLVVDQSRLPVGPTRVDLVLDKKIVESKLTKEGMASFCDFGAGDHQIVVEGQKGCYRSSISGIKLSAFAVQRIVIASNVCFYPGAHTSPPGCSLLTRILQDKQNDDQPVRVTVMSGSNNEWSVELDSFKRFQSFVRLNEEITIRVFQGDTILASENAKCSEARDIIKEIRIP